MPTHFVFFFCWVYMSLCLMLQWEWRAIIIIHVKERKMCHREEHWFVTERKCLAAERPDNEICQVQWFSGMIWVSHCKQTCQTTRKTFASRLQNGNVKPKRKDNRLDLDPGLLFYTMLSYIRGHELVIIILDLKQTIVDAFCSPELNHSLVRKWIM